MLFVTGRFKAILGFAAGGAGLVLFTTVLKGPGVWPGFFRMARDFAAASSGLHARSFLHLENYVDLTSFSSLVPGGRSRLGVIILAGCVGWVAFALAKVWWKSRAAGKPTMALVWATTLTWTLVLNVYVPMYDTILIVISLIMTAGVLEDLRNESLDRGFTRLWLALFASCWIGRRVASAIGIQIVTILLCAIGMFQVAALRQMYKLPQKSHTS